MCGALDLETEYKRSSPNDKYYLFILKRLFGVAEEASLSGGKVFI